jgi:quercetin dioxygenase-like cupin family protein
VSEVFVMDQDSLPLGGNSHEFEGDDFGNAGVSFILVDAPPGGGPSLHRHPHAEVFVVQQGRATFILDDRSRR